MEVVWGSNQINDAELQGAGREWEFGMLLSNCWNFDEQMIHKTKPIWYGKAFRMSDGTHKILLLENG